MTYVPRIRGASTIGVVSAECVDLKNIFDLLWWGWAFFSCRLVTTKALKK